ncbi:MAG TPA: SRPBCC family protein [Acidimicrobiales bacterium]|nr:SRPBCC family protein [Acidimicrobiales bacterium]
MDGDIISVERVIAAPPEAIFAYLADASRHSEIDGSGTVKGTRSGGPEPLALGTTFGMSMKLGLPYRMVSTVVEFEPDRRIAWQSHAPGPLGKLFGGRIWRYVLEPVGESTRVVESWDLSRDKQRFALRLGPLPERTRQNMQKTLERIEQLVTSG